MQRLIDQGTLHERDVSSHPWRNVVLGSIDGDPAETADVVPLRRLPGDRVLPASDGLTDLVGVRGWAWCSTGTATTPLPG